VSLYYGINQLFAPKKINKSTFAFLDSNNLPLPNRTSNKTRNDFFLLHSQRNDEFDLLKKQEINKYHNLRQKK
jgi:hypothetical protein